MIITMKCYHGYGEYNSNLPLRMRLNLMRIRFALRSHGANKFASHQIERRKI